MAWKFGAYAKLVRNLICGQILVRNWVSGFALDPIPYKNLPATAVSNYNLEFPERTLTITKQSRSHTNKVMKNILRTESD